MKTIEEKEMDKAIKRARRKFLKSNSRRYGKHYKIHKLTIKEIKKAKDILDKRTKVDRDSMFLTPPSKRIVRDLLRYELKGERSSI